MVETAVCLTHADKRVTLTWDTGGKSVHLSIDMVGLTLGWAVQEDHTFSDTKLVFMPPELLVALVRIGVPPPPNFKQPEPEIPHVYTH